MCRYEFFGYSGGAREHTSIVEDEWTKIYILSSKIDCTCVND